MTPKERLIDLLKDSDKHRDKFAMVELGQVGQGYKPIHFKRLSIPLEEADKIADYGAAMLWMHFDVRLYYTQALIAGSILSGKFDKIIIVTPSQYGKSWLLGHIALLYAYQGHKVNVVASTGDRTGVIMSYTARSVADAVPEIKQALSGDQLRKIERLDQSLSKTKISFAQGGSVEGFSLGDTFDDMSRNKAIGRGGAYIVDEAALVSDDSLAEIGRSEFSQTDGSREVVCMISNPHKPGTFYDDLTQEHVPDRTLIVWSDILTACQEGRWNADYSLNTTFANHTDTIERYLLCELPGSGSGMFGDVRVSTEPAAGIHVLGVDAAYKGKDNIEVCDCVITTSGVHFEAVEAIKKPTWIDGVTSTEIADQIARIYHKLGAALVCVDVGFGVWLVEALALRGVNVKGINFGAGATKERVKARHYAATNAQNMRAEMHLDLQDLIDNRKATFSPAAYAQIKEVLPYVTSERKATGKIAVIPKIEIKNKIGHSPDALDAVLLALHAAVLYSEESVSFIA